MREVRQGATAVIVLVLVALGGSTASAQAAGCPNHDAQLNYNCSRGPTYLIPGLTDLTGWKERSHYRNILVGDIDGDKVDEMVVRSVGGIQVFRWDRTSGQWTQVKVARRILSDAGVWGGRPYYDTIRLGDIDGDGRAELIARSPQGIIVFKYKASSRDVGDWQQVTTSGPMKDTDCWFPPGGGQHECENTFSSYYSTIQLTPLGREGSKPTMQLIGRTRYGLELWKWNGTGWDQKATLAAAADDGNATKSHWRDDPAYYSTILPLSTTDVLIQAARGMQVYRYDGSGWAPQGSLAPFPAPQPPSSYSTLQRFRGLAGGPVVLRRGQAGVQLWQWSGSSWTAIAKGTLPFSNAEGFTQPYYDRPIQAADIDGDGLDELLGRSSRGMYTYRFNPSTKTWSASISTNRPALADDPWSDPAYYTTIKTARLDPNKPTRSLLARGPTGVRTWHFDPRPGKNLWTRYQRYGFPPLPAKAYAAMNTLLGFVNSEIRDQYATNPSDDTVRRWQNLIQGTCTGASGPVPLQPTRFQSCTLPRSGVSAADWTTVANQIFAELYWEGPANDYFTVLSNIQKTLRGDQTGEFGSITADLKLDQAKNVAAPMVNYLELFEGIFDILAESPEAGELFGVTGAALGITDSASAALAAQPTQFDKTIAQLQATLATIQQEAEDAVTEHRRYVLGDWGLMRTVGRLQASTLWQLDPLAARSASRQGFARWVYSQYLPAIWDHWEVGNCYIPDGCAQQGKLMPYYATYFPDNTVSFHGLVPRQTPCGVVYCGWYSLESHNYKPTIDELVTPITRACTYDGTTDGNIWEFGTCTLGIDPSQLLRTDPGRPFKFRTYYCDYSVQSNDDRYCWKVQNQYGVSAASARGVRTRHRKRVLIPR